MNDQTIAVDGGDQGEGSSNGYPDGAQVVDVIDSTADGITYTPDTVVIAWGEEA